MKSIARYVRLWFYLGRYALVRELAFRANYVAKLSVEILWLAILLLLLCILSLTGSSLLPLLHAIIHRLEPAFWRPPSDE